MRYSSYKPVGKKTVRLHHCRCSCKLLLFLNPKAHFSCKRSIFYIEHLSHPHPVLREKEVKVDMSFLLLAHIYSDSHVVVQKEFKFKAQRMMLMLWDQLVSDCQCPSLPSLFLKPVNTLFCHIQNFVL